MDDRNAFLYFVMILAKGGHVYGILERTHRHAKWYLNSKSRGTLSEGQQTLTHG